MGKVTIVAKSRKEFKCNKCRKDIPVGSKYYRGELNFARPIIRCADCGLESWEVTTSDFQLSVGRIANKWREDFDASADGVNDIISSLEEIRDDLECRLDNMPEGLRDADTGCLLQERIDMLESVISDLEDIDEDTLKEEVLDEYEPDSDEDIKSESEDDDDDDEEKEWDDENEDLTSALAEKYEEYIDEALSNIEY